MMQFLKRFALSLLAGLATLSISPINLANADESLWTKSFHEDEWVFISARHPKAHTNLLGPYKEPADSPEKFFQFVSSYTFPGNAVGDLSCVSVEKADFKQYVGSVTIGPVFDRAFVSDVRRRLNWGAEWMITPDAGFKRIQKYASGEQYKLTRNLVGWPGLEPMNKTVNYFGCSTAGFMSVNAQLNSGQSNFLKIGPELEGRFSANKYRFLLDWLAMHELTHIYQNNYSPFREMPHVNLRAYNWGTEGIADAIGVHRLFEKYGGQKATLQKIRSYNSKAYTDGLYRRAFLLRNYNIPLNFNATPEDEIKDFRTGDRQVLKAIDSAMLNLLDYETNGFWYHVLERYLNKKPGRFTTFMESLTMPPHNYTQKVDDYLDRIDGGSMQGLEHVYPQFLAEFTNWWEDRTAKMLTEDEWMTIAYSKCEPIKLSGGKAAKAVATFELSEYGAECFDIEIDGSVAHRLNSLDLIADAQDGGADELYMGMARIKGTLQNDGRCIDVIKKFSVKTAPCLMDPVQGFVAWKGGANSQGKPRLARNFHLAQMKGKKGTPVTIRLVAVRVPEKHKDLYNALERRLFRLQASVNLAALKTKKKRKPVSQEDVEGLEIELQYGEMVGFSAIIPETPADKKCVDSIYTPTIDPKSDVSNVNQSAYGPRRMIGMKEVFEDGREGRRIAVMMQKPLKFGQTGEIPVTGMGEMLPTGDGSGDAVSGTISMQDTQLDSRLEILSYNDGSIDFRATVNLCTIAVTKLTQGKTPCEGGDKQSFEMEGTVAFPTIKSGETRMAENCTEPYKAYRMLRVEKIKARFGGFDGFDPFKPPSPPDPFDTKGGGGSGGGEAKVCSIRKADQSCDCSCAAKACYDRKYATSSPGRDLSCKLTCGKNWKACSP